MKSDRNAGEQDKTPEQQSDELISTAVSPGEQLRQARQAQAMTKQQIADKLFLKMAVVDDLENDRVDTSKPLTFTKGYVRNYAKLLGLDADAVLTDFDKLHQKPTETAKLQSFSKRVAQQAHDDRWMMVTYVILVVLIAAVVIWWYQQPSTSVGVDNNGAATSSTTSADPSTQQSAETNLANTTQRQSSDNLGQLSVPQSIDAAQDSEGNVMSEALNANQETIDISEAVTEQSVTDQTSLGTLSINETILDVVDDSVSAQPESEPADVAASAENVVPLPPDPDSSLVSVAAELEFTFAEDCWVNIQDGTGETIAYGVKRKGYVMPLSGVPPFEVTLGAPQVVSISYNGESVDMSQYSGTQIARMILPKQD